MSTEDQAAAEIAYLQNGGRISRYADKEDWFADDGCRRVPAEVVSAMLASRKVNEYGFYYDNPMLPSTSGDKIGLELSIP